MEKVLIGKNDSAQYDDNCPTYMAIKDEDEGVLISKIIEAKSALALISGIEKITLSLPCSITTYDEDEKEISLDHYEYYLEVSNFSVSITGTSNDNGESQTIVFCSELIENLDQKIAAAMARTESVDDNTMLIQVDKSLLDDVARLYELTNQRDELNRTEDYDDAFEVECELRDIGLDLAVAIEEGAKALIKDEPIFQHHESASEDANTAVRP